MLGKWAWGWASNKNLRRRATSWRRSCGNDGRSQSSAENKMSPATFPRRFDIPVEAYTQCPPVSRALSPLSPHSATTTGPRSRPSLEGTCNSFHLCVCVGVGGAPEGTACHSLPTLTARVWFHSDTNPPLPLHAGAPPGPRQRRGGRPGLPEDSGSPRNGRVGLSIARIGSPHLRTTAVQMSDCRPVAGFTKTGSSSTVVGLFRDVPALNCMNIRRRHLTFDTTSTSTSFSCRDIKILLLSSRLSLTVS